VIGWLPVHDPAVAVSVWFSTGLPEIVGSCVLDGLFGAVDDYAQAAALREALRLFQRRSEAITAPNGLTSRTYQLLLMIKTSRGRERARGSGRARRTASARKEHRHRDRPSKREAWARPPGTRPQPPQRDLDPPHHARRAGLAKAVEQLGDERRSLIDLLSQLKN
jgi:hypothetical protein